MGIFICSDFVLACLFYSDFPWGMGRVVTVFAHRKREGYLSLLSFVFLKMCSFSHGWPPCGWECE